MTETTGGLRRRLRRAGRAVVTSLFGDGPAFPERVQHHLVAFEIEQNDDIDEVLAIRSRGSVYQISRYVTQSQRTVTLQTERGKRVVKSDRIVGVTILDSWHGTPPEATFDSYADVFERHGWPDRTVYPGRSGE